MNYSTLGPGVPGTLSVSHPDYKYDEGSILDEVRAYVDSTYDQHYASGKYQATDMIVDAGHGVGFVVGNIMKYAMRLGKKDGWNVKDVFKIIHYCVILVWVLRTQNLVTEKK